MITSEKDPLRFLKPRKKQFHLTPTKSQTKPEVINILSSSSVTLPNPNSQCNIPYSKRINDASESSQKYIRTSKQVPFIQSRCARASKQKSQISKQFEQFMKASDEANLKSQGSAVPCYNTFTKHIQPQNNCTSYQPMKYFSLQITQYLKKKKQDRNRQPPQFNNNSQMVSTHHHSSNNQKVNQQKQLYLNDSFNLINQDGPNSTLFIPILKDGNNHIHGEQSEATMRVQDYFDPQDLESNKTTPRTEKSQKSQQFFNQSKQHVNCFQSAENLQEQKKNLFVEKNKKSDQQILTYQPQKKECEICGRSFNIASYNKHIKVCQKVFFKKRKQFSSEKQRSKSKTK